MRQDRGAARCVQQRVRRHGAERVDGLEEARVLDDGERGVVASVGEVREEPGHVERDPGRRARAFGERVHRLGKRAEPVQAGVDLDVDASGCRAAAAAATARIPSASRTLMSTPPAISSSSVDGGLQPTTRIGAWKPAARSASASCGV